MSQQFKKITTLFLAVVLVLGLAACSKPAETKENTQKEETNQQQMTKEEPKQEEAKQDEKKEEKVQAEKPGESGFDEIIIGEGTVGPFTVAAVYFQAVDMYPVGKNPSKEESDMHLEADIHFLSEYAQKYGFGSGEDIWPAYLTVKYEVFDKDNKVVAEGSFMPMNASDGPHYGTNVKKNLMTVGQYKLKLTILPPTDYLLHIDDETGVEAKEGAKAYFETQTIEFDWNYTGQQLQNQ